MRILGIDHGTTITGYALLDADLKDGQVEYRYNRHGTIERPAGMKYPYTVKYMVSKLRDVLAETRPHYVALEAPKDNRGFKATQVLTELLGAIKALCMETGYGFVEIPPMTMKKTVTGYGWSNKEEVARAAAEQLGLPFEKVVKAEYYKSGAKEGQLKKLILDGSDALGLALTLVDYSKKAGGLDYNPKEG